MKPVVYKRVITLLAVVLLALSTCKKTEKLTDPAQQHRMAELKKQLQAELGDRYEQPLPAATADQLKRGAELYPQVCASCHGGRGDGQGRITEGLVDTPTSFTDPQQATFFSDQARLHIIGKGIPGTPMMGWSGVLNEEDILAVYVYIRSLIRKK